MIQRKVNDFHVHLGRSNGIYHSLPLEDVDTYIEKFNIENIALMPFELDTDRDNLKIIELSKKTNTIHGLFWIQKHRIQEDLEILKSEINNSLIGVKFHGAFEKLAVTNPIYSPIMKFLNDKHSIILIHCGRFKDGHFDSLTSFEHGIILAKKYPHLKVVLAHMGGNDTSVVKKAVNASASLENVYFDTSGISTGYRVEYAVDQVGPSRILFGSDYPWCSFRGNFYHIEDSLLDEKTKNMIFYENFLKLIQ